MTISLLPLLLSKSTKAAPPTTEAQLKLLESRGFTVTSDPRANLVPGFEIWWNDQFLLRCLDWSTFFSDPSRQIDPLVELVEQTSHWARNPQLFRSIVSLFWSEVQQPPQLIAYTKLETVGPSGRAISLTFHSIESAVILVESLGQATRTKSSQSLTTQLFNGVPGKTPDNATFRLAHVRENFFVFGCDVADGNNSHYEQLVEVRFGEIRPLGDFYRTDKVFEFDYIRSRLDHILEKIRSDDDQQPPSGVVVDLIPYLRQQGSSDTPRDPAASSYALATAGSGLAGDLVIAFSNATQQLGRWFSDVLDVAPARTTTPEGFVGVSVPETPTASMSAATDAIADVKVAGGKGVITGSKVTPFLDSTLGGALGGALFGFAELGMYASGVSEDTRSTLMGSVGVGFITHALLANPVLGALGLAAGLPGAMAGHQLDKLACSPDDGGEPVIHLFTFTGFGASAGAGVWTLGHYAPQFVKALPVVDIAAMPGVNILAGAAALGYLGKTSLEHQVETGQITGEEYCDRVNQIVSNMM